MENKKINFIKIMLFPLIALVFLLIYGVYNIYISNQIISEISTLRTSVTNNIENFYIQTINNFVKDQNTNITKDQALSIINKNFNFFTTTIVDSLSRKFYHTIYISIFLVIVMFLWAIFVIYTTNISASRRSNVVLKPVEENNDKDIINNKNTIIEDNNNITANENKVVEHKNIEVVKKPLPVPEEFKEIIVNNKDIEKIESLYQELIGVIKSSEDNRALDILESIFSIDDRNYLALNGAGILYSNMYSRNNKDLYFTKADKFYDSAISIYNNKDVLNNKAILYSLRYGIDKSDNDYSKALTVYDNMIYSHKNDIELLNNRANIYSTKYGVTGNNELFENALKSYNELLESHYNNIFLLNNRSVLFFNKYKRTNDKAFFNKSIEDCNLAFKLNDSGEELNNNKPIYMYKY